MVKQNKVKRTILSIILTLCFSIGSFLFIDPSKANNNIWDYNFTSTNQGVTATASGYGCVFADYYASNSTQNTRYKHVITINFSDYVSGSVHLTFTFSRGDIFLSRYCTLGFTSSTSGFDVYVYNTNYCEIEVYTQYETSFLLDILSHAGPDSTSDHYLLTDATEYLYYIDQNMQSVQSDIADIKQYLDNSDLDSVAGYLDTINQYIYNDLDDYLNLLLYLEDQNTGVGYLQEIYQFVQQLNITDYSTAFADILNSLTTVNTNLTNIYSRLNSMNTTLTNISTQLSTSFHSNLDVPRWQLPAMRWAQDVGYSSGQYSTWSMTSSTGWFQRYTNNAGDLAFTSSKAIYVPVDSKYILAWASTSSGAGCNIYYSRLAANSLLPLGITVEEFYGTTANGGYRNGMYYNYIIITNSYTPQNTESIGFEVEFTSRRYICPLYLGPYSSMPQEAYSLIGLDYIDPNTSILTNIDSTISNIEEYLANLTPDETVIDQSTQVNIDLNADMTIVSNVETNILTDIDLQFNNVNQIISSFDHMHTTPLGVANGINLFDYIYGRIQYAFSYVDWIFYLIMIGFVLLAILG